MKKIMARVAFVSAVALASVGGLAAPAFASTITHVTAEGLLVVKAGAGESNDIVVKRSPDNLSFVITDKTASLTAGSGCHKTISSVVCPAAGVYRIQVNAGDLDDRVVVDGDDDALIFGEEGSDILVGGGGDDMINGSFGDDQILGGAGADHMQGGAGEDKIFGAAGEDYLHGGPDIDKLYGGDDNDRIFGMSGDDTIRGEGGFDTVDGGDGSQDDCIGESLANCEK